MMSADSDVITALQSCCITGNQANHFVNQCSIVNLSDCLFFRPEIDKGMIKESTAIAANSTRRWGH